VGKLLVIAGLLVAFVGLLVMLGVPIGRLPGDLSSIVASILLTLLLAFLRR
jgi:hypothetical protein